MPKKTTHPKLRAHCWKTARGEVKCAYYYDMRGTGEKDVPLGSDFESAVRQWDELHNRKPRIAGTILEGFERWERECLSEYANATTRRNYAQNMRKLKPVFGPATWDQITVATIAQYLTKRSAKTQANREKALFSVVWGKAREWGLTNLPFPAYKMRLRNKESAQDVEVSQAAFDAVYRHAPQHLQTAMDVISATGLRVRDCLALRVSDFKEGALSFESSKTGKRGTFGIAPGSVLQLAIQARKAVNPPHIFLLTAGNRVVTERMLTDAWKRARAKALPECPEVKGLMLRHMRKYAAQQAGSLQEAQQLLQHGSAATTQRHYRGREKLRPVR